MCEIEVENLQAFQTIFYPKKKRGTEEDED